MLFSGLVSRCYLPEFCEYMHYYSMFLRVIA